ncbi:MAG: hypothetical protein M3323_08640 [Actinomycetota bacterium]|nr:hypothetical protein [Actinomycetota bacterium]
MRRLVVIPLVAASLLGAAPLDAQEPDAIVYSTYRYAGRGAGSAIFTIVPGGERVRLTGSRSFNLQPVWSPDRSRVAYVHHARPRNPDIWVMDADGTEKVRLTTGRRDDSSPQWSPDGASIAWVKTRPDSPTGRIYVMDGDGSDKRLLAGEAEDAVFPRWSPDGGKIAFLTKLRCNDCPTDLELSVIDADGSNETSLTDNDVHDATPAWAPDSSRIVFARERDDGGDLFTIAPDGSGEERLTSLDGIALLPEWAPHGAEIAFMLLVDAENFHTRLGVVDVATGDERVLTDVETGGILPSWSPDGDRIAFLGFHSGGHNVGVVGRDGSGLTQVTQSETDEGWLDW